MKAAVHSGWCVVLLIGILIPSGQTLNLANFGLGDFKLENVLNLDNMATMMNWLSKLTDRCRANNVKLDMAFMLQGYMCLSNMESTLISGDEVDTTYLDKVCREWPKVFKCFRPLFEKLEKCFSMDRINLEGVLTGGVEVLLTQLCKHDTSFINALIHDGPEVLTCLTNRTQKVVHYITKCFNDYKSPGVTVCQGFDLYKDCFIKSFSVCDNPRAEKLVYKLVDEVGIKNVIYKNILKCDSTTKKIGKEEKPTSTKTEL